MMGGTHFCCAPQFTLTVAEDGKSGVGKDSTFAGCLPMSPIPCCLCCGFGPLAYIMPSKIEDAGDGNVKWVGNGQVCVGGCCPCLTNTGDSGLYSPETDGSTAEKAHLFYPVSMVWPPCINGICCGKDKASFRAIQKGVSPVVKKGGVPAAAEMQR